ncbi:MAG: SDR family oxidoreductase [Acidimicrobiales bacterium]
MTILIAGGSTGIGRAIAEHFGATGHDVLINYHADDQAAEECVATITARGGRAAACKADLGTPDGVVSLAAWVKNRTDRLDQMVYGSVTALSGQLLSIDAEEMRRCLEVNPLGMIWLTRELLPILGEGSTLFYLSSQGALVVLPDYGPLGISKALGEHILRYLAVELAPRGVRALTISAGTVDTPALRAVFPDSYKRRLRAAAERNLAGRPLAGADIARAIEQLSRPEFSMTTGERIRVDGGVTL